VEKAMTAFTIADLTFRDLLRPDVLANPYPLFAQLRREDPVHEDPAGEGWLVTRYDDVTAVMSDPRFSAARLLPREGEGGAVSTVRRALARQMLFLDPPDHSRLRKLFAKAFTPGRLETLRGPILGIVEDLFDAASTKAGEIDFIRDFAVPLPVTVIATMLGVPSEDHHRLRSWSSGFGRLISGRLLTSQEAGEAESSILAFIAYFQALIETRRRQPADDMLSDLVAVEEMGDRLSLEELIMNLILLLAAGHGTTTHLLGNGLLALLRHPEQWRLLTDDPSLAAPAVNELLRFDGPVQATSREALEDVELGGKVIRRGQRARMLLGSANHDDAHFPEPDRLDIQRPGARILSFGHGIHTCLGAALARLEAQVAFVESTRRFPDTRLQTTNLEWGGSISFRGLQSLPVVLA
jgi:cytochrome P450